MTDPTPPVTEWVTDPDGTVHLLDGPPRLGFGRWVLANHAMAPGLGVKVTDPTTGQTYDAWLPESEAVAVRNQILYWWPLDRFPSPSA